MKRIMGYGVVLLLMIVLTAQTGIAFETKEPAVPDLKQLEAAAQQGDAKAMYELGKSYENGVGVIQNYVQAHVWYNIASSRGYTDAPKARDAVAKKMSVNQLEKAQELALNWKPSKVSASVTKGNGKEGEVKSVGAKETGAKEVPGTICDAAKIGDTARVKELLKQGASPNMKDKDGWFPLMYAAFKGHKDTVDALLEAGADVNMKKPDGSTALMAATLGGHKAVVETLLAKGADGKAENAKGLTARVMAEKKGYAEIVELLSGNTKDALTGMEFVFVKGGCFRMGSDEGGNPEKPVHEVYLDDYCIGKYEVTQGQWSKIMGNNPSGFKNGDNYPVENVSWDDIQVFLEKLNQKTRQNYRLPTEAEWEYAARSRGGKQERWAGTSNEAGLAGYVWFEKNSENQTHPVGQKTPNGLGIYDMSGNVWEWCWDWYGYDYYSKSPRNNPNGPSSGSGRVNRGGSWSLNARYLRASNRHDNAPADSYYSLGFRLARTP